MVKALIFDLDDTLSDRQASIEQYILKLTNTYFPEADAVRQSFIAERFREADQNGYRDKKDVYEMLVADLSWSNPPTAQEYISFFKQELARCIKPMEHLFIVLDYFKSKGVPMGMITNGSVQLQGDKIDQLGIRDYFDTVVISAEAGISKPHPDIYAIALERLSMEPAHVWFIGDHPHNDIVGAVKCGMKGIWMTRNGVWDDSNEHKPYKSIRSLKELIPLYENAVNVE
ncbi:HAD family hydrolase [Neobacillus mesonae]|nr:HAD family hydrolase [Neobacillus mesonae]